MTKRTKNEQRFSFQPNMGSKKRKRKRKLEHDFFVLKKYVKAIYKRVTNIQ